MGKPLVLIVHGMGTHTKDSVLQEFKDGIKTALALYDGLPLSDFESDVDLLPVVYSDFIDTHRDNLKNNASLLADKLGAIGGNLSLVANVSGAVNEIDAKLGGDDFFYTHWLDVILYRYTMLSEPIQAMVADALAKGLTTHGRASKDIHIVSHSLGTSVTHDALAKVYGSTQFDDPSLPRLDPITSPLGSLHQVANVSRLLQSFVNVRSSVVRPGSRGCIGMFKEYRHHLDPFTVPRAFDPTNNGEWISVDDYDDIYSLSTGSEVTAANTHALAHYLANPRFHVSLLKTIWKKFRPTKTKIRKATDQYVKETAQGKARAVRELIEDVDFGSKSSVLELLDAARRFKNLLSGFGETFR